MKRVFTAWGRAAGGEVTTFSAGEEPPRLANGEPDQDSEVVLWRVEAGAWEEAMAIRNLRCGYEPHKPLGEAAPCPICASLHYPNGSGQCWSCDYEG